MSFWEKVWNIRKNFNHRNVSFSKCWLFRRISCNIIMSIFRKSFVRIRWFSSKKFLIFVFILCKCMIVFFRFSSFRWICFARKIKKSTIVWIFFHDKICQIETFNFINKTAFVSVMIRREIISVNLFIIVRSAHNTEWKWRIHFSSSSKVNFERAFFIEIYFRSIISLTCEWKTDTINRLIRYFWVKVFISFLFFESSSIIKRSKHSCRQMIFSYMKRITDSKSVFAKALFSTHFERFFRTNIK